MALTADVDPDANLPVPGRPDAASAGAPPGEVSLEACAEGLARLLEVLRRHGLPATLFWEGRSLEALAGRPALREAIRDPSLEHGCHGYRHEDFAGAGSGLPLGPADTRRALECAGRAFAATFGSAPRGFRAPYCRMTEELAVALGEAGYRYDASLTRSPSPEWGLRPYAPEGAPGLWELALCRARDRTGRPISGYLWQLFEGRRGPADYLYLAGSLRETCAGGLLQIALHPWHLLVAADGRPFGVARAEEHARRLEELLRGLAAMEGVAFTSAGAYLEAATAGAA